MDAGIRDGYRTAMAGMAGMAVAGKAGGKVAHATSSGVKVYKIHFLQIKEQKNARSSAKSVADEIHDKHMLDNAGSYNKRDNQKIKDEKALLTQITQIYSKIKARKTVILILEMTQN